MKALFSTKSPRRTTARFEPVWLKILSLDTCSHSLELALTGNRVVSPAEPLSARTRIVDGLEGLSEMSVAAGENSSRWMSHRSRKSGRVVPVELLGRTLAVRFFESSIRVRSAANTPPRLAATRVAALGLETFRRSRVGSISLPAAPAIHREDACLVSGTLNVCDETARMLLAPYIRGSLPLDSLGQREIESFLREGELLQQVPMHEGEIVGVFPRIPIEMISRIRFSPERKLLFYTLSKEPGLHQTRLHDLAVVRNLETGKIHLIPHRTRFQIVVLN